MPKPKEYRLLGYLTIGLGAAVMALFIPLMQLVSRASLEGGLLATGIFVALVLVAGGGLVALGWYFLRYKARTLP
ncbi:MAG: hypothetical protein KQJ78_08885 [Deltaproteobacteria bacterium]|nr:hypothetical protein [Deltaproteobacteria bacterium]